MICSGLKRILISFAGTPPIILYGAHDFVTTAPAATMLPRPIVTPFKIVTFAPHKTPSSMQQVSPVQVIFRHLLHQLDAF